MWEVPGPAHARIERPITDQGWAAEPRDAPIHRASVANMIASNQTLLTAKWLDLEVTGAGRPICAALSTWPVRARVVGSAWCCGDTNSQTTMPIQMDLVANAARITACGVASCASLV